MPILGILFLIPRPRIQSFIQDRLFIHSLLQDTAVAAMDDYVEYNDYEYCDDYEILPDSDAGMFITDGKGKL